MITIDHIWLNPALRLPLIIVMLFDTGFLLFGFVKFKELQSFKAYGVTTMAKIKEVQNLYHGTFKAVVQFTTQTGSVTEATVKGARALGRIIRFKVDDEISVTYDSQNPQRAIYKDSIFYKPGYYFLAIALITLAILLRATNHIK